MLSHRIADLTTKYPYTPTRILKLKSLTMQSINKNVEQVVYSYIVGGNTDMELPCWKAI